LCGTLDNPRLPHGDSQGSVDLKINRILKADPILAGKKVVEINRYVPVEKGKAPPEYLIFFDIYQGKLDPYKGDRVQSEAVLRYLEPLAAAPAKRDLLYFFRHLDHVDPLVAEDALMEFVHADYRDVFPLAKNLPPDRLAGWLKDAKLSGPRVRL